MALKTSLISCWELDEASGNAIDSHSSGYDLTDTNTVGANTGKVGGARVFVPANVEYFTRASNSDFQTGDIDFTLAAWVYFTNTAGTQSILTKYTTTGNQREYGLVRVAGNAARFIISATGGSTTVNVDTSALSTDTWYWLACGHNASSNQLWIAVNNGTPTTTSHSGGVFAGSAAMTIGGINAGSAWLMDGRVDQACLWKRDLRDTPSDMAAIYNSGSGLAYSSWDAATGNRRRRFLIGAAS